MITSLLSEWDHNSQWQRQVYKETELNKKTFEMATAKETPKETSWTAEMEDRLVNIWQEHNCQYNMTSNT